MVNIIFLNFLEIRNSEKLFFCNVFILHDMLIYVLLSVDMTEYDFRGGMGVIYFSFLMLFPKIISSHRNLIPGKSIFYKSRVRENNASQDNCFFFSNISRSHTWLFYGTAQTISREKSKLLTFQLSNAIRREKKWILPYYMFFLCYT